jgi:hypothetical protein
MIYIFYSNKTNQLFETPKTYVENIEWLTNYIKAIEIYGGYTYIGVL